MKERPIIFSGEMVRAILDGKKTQTRRVIKPQPLPHHWEGHTYHYLSAKLLDTTAGFSVRFQHILGGINSADPFWVKCPYGKPGDRLWVRESWYECIDNNDTFRFVADGPPPTTDRRHYKRRASIHLPRRGARIILEITDIRVERLQDITEEDARAEGIVDGGCLSCGESEPCGCDNPRPDARDAFAWLWSSINGKSPGKDWHDNSWVWAVGFRRVSDEH